MRKTRFVCGVLEGVRRLRVIATTGVPAESTHSIAGTRHGQIRHRVNPASTTSHNTAHSSTKMGVPLGHTSTCSPISNYPAQGLSRYDKGASGLPSYKPSGMTGRFLPLLYCRVPTKSSLAQYLLPVSRYLPFAHLLKICTLSPHHAARSRCLCVVGTEVHRSTSERERHQAILRSDGRFPQRSTPEPSHSSNKPDFAALRPVQTFKHPQRHHQPSIASNSEKPPSAETSASERYLLSRLVGLLRINDGGGETEIPT
jgi:hypothetical protein